MLAVYKEKPATSKWLFNLFGWIFVLLGFIGILLPVMPTTPFLIVAAWCFTRGSERYAKWLRRHKWFGPIIIEWEEKRCIRHKYKYFALFMMILGASFSIYHLKALHWQLITASFVAIGCIVVLNIPSCDKK